MTKALDIGVDAAATQGSKIVVRGELDIATAPELVEAIREIPPEQRLVLDLSNVSFIDSSGLRALLEARDVIAESGSTLVLHAPEGSVSRLLQLAGVAEWFDYE